MNAENFSSFLQDPSKLYQIPYQELKSLVVQYPYCQPLRILLLQKSQLEQHPDFERNLEMAATYLPDRKVLYLLVREYQALEKGTPLFELEDERLELKTLDELLAERGQQTQSLEVSHTAPPPATEETTFLEDSPEEPQAPEKQEDHPPIDFTPTLPEHPEEEEEPATPEIAAAPEDTEPEEEQTDLPEPVQETDAETPDLAEIEALFEEEEEEEEEQEVEEWRSGEVERKAPGERPQPLPKSAFASWDARYGALRSLVSLDTFDLPVAKTAEKKEREEALEEIEEAPSVEPQELARQSVAEKAGIATETLAELLVKQGHIQKAITMYEKLCLIFPEKNTFFAQKIEMLKRK